MRRNKCIDTFKGIACILVIFIHYPFPGKIGEVIKVIARVAVPFFFMVSGYFFSLKDQSNIVATGKRMITRILKLLIIGMIFSEVFIVLQQHSLISTIKNQITVNSIIRLLLFNDTGAIYHLWYLWAVIYCYGIFTLLHKYIKGKKHFTILFIVVIVINIVLSIVDQRLLLFENYILRNWLFTGVPFFGLGFCFSYIHRWKCKWITYSLIGVGAFGSIMENEFWGKMDLYVGTVLLTIGLLSYAIEHSEKEICKRVTELGNKYSSWVYVLHWGAMHVEYKIVNDLQLKSLFEGVYLYLSPICLAIYTIVLAVIVVKIIGLFDSVKKRLLN